MLGEWLLFLLVALRKTTEQELADYCQRANINMIKCEIIQTFGVVLLKYLLIYVPELIIISISLRVV